MNLLGLVSAAAAWPIPALMHRRNGPFGSGFLLIGDAEPMGPVFHGSSGIEVTLKVVDSQFYLSVPRIGRQNPASRTGKGPGWQKSVDVTPWPR